MRKTSMNTRVKDLFGKRRFFHTLLTSARVWVRKLFKGHEHGYTRTHFVEENESENAALSFNRNLRDSDGVTRRNAD